MNNTSLKEFLKTQQDFFDIKIIGKSHLGQEIFAVNKIYDKPSKWVLLTGGIHGRENLSCDFLCHFIKKLATISQQNFNFSFVPLVNPDGAGIALGELCNKKIAKLNKGQDIALYKANARGVDLNNNFDALWQEKYTGKQKPSSQGYYGKKPFSENETKALKNWTEKLDLFLCLSYHLKGEEIYYDFFQTGKNYLRDSEIAKIFASSTGYKIKPSQYSSSGGFKDWCVSKLKIPALTIELGSDSFSHPYPKKELDNIINKNKNLFSDIQKAFDVFNLYNF
jgi:g-D-glutamyl-meso-diaminopimelate peptidase